MAYINISSATIRIATTPNRNGIGETTAFLYYDCSATLIQSSNFSGELEMIVYSYTPLTYTWTINGYHFNGANGTGRVYGLAKGAKNSISGSVEISCDETRNLWVRSPVYDCLYDEETGEAIPGTDGLGNFIRYTEWANVSTSVSKVSGRLNTNYLTAWTRPGSFIGDGGGWMMNKDGTIQSPSGLTSGWTQLWTTHMNKIGNWYNQSSGDIANECTQAQKALITANWYNTCSSKINIYTDGEGHCGTVVGGKSGTVISAQLINDLANNNKKTGEV